MKIQRWKVSVGATTVGRGLTYSDCVIWIDRYGRPGEDYVIWHWQAEDQAWHQVSQASIADSCGRRSS